MTNAADTDTAAVLNRWLTLVSHDSHADPLTPALRIAEKEAEADLQQLEKDVRAYRKLSRSRPLRRSPPSAGNTGANDAPRRLRNSGTPGPAGPSRPGIPRQGHAADRTHTLLHSGAEDHHPQ